MKRATKLGRPPKVVEWANKPPQPEAETGHNLYVAIRELTNVMKGIDERTKLLDERTKRLEDAVVPPTTWGRVKSAVGM